MELRGDAEDEDEAFVVEEERDGWKGYVEWEDYPEKKAKAHKRFLRYKFPPPPEFQLGPVPGTNPVLEGVRWKLWHESIGGALTGIPDESWKTVLEVRNRTWPAHTEMLNNFHRRNTLTCCIFSNFHTMASLPKDC